MTDPVSLERLLYRLLFVAIAATILFVGILPFKLGSDRVPGPDLILLTAFAWVLRRPDYMPALLVAGVLLVEDVLFMRPLGLTACLGLIALEYLRSREPIWRDLPFPLEWAMVAAVMLALTVAQAAILGLFMVDQPAVPAQLVQVSLSILCYPFVTAFSRYVFRVAKPAPGEVDALGHKL